MNVNKEFWRLVGAVIVAQLILGAAVYALTKGMKHPAVNPGGVTGG